MKIINNIINYNDIDYLDLREKLYSIFTYDKTEKIFIKLHKFLKLYNNNYRPIYHLESFVCYLCIVIHGLQ